jgi:hypothetical protein
MFGFAKLRIVTQFAADLAVAGGSASPAIDSHSASQAAAT